jgi:hypothetical protein
MSGCRLRLADKREAWENRLFGGEEFLWNVLPFGSPDAAAYIQRRTAVAALIQRSQRKKLNTEDLACSRSFDNFWLAVGREPGIRGLRYHVRHLPHANLRPRKED